MVRQATPPGSGHRCHTASAVMRTVCGFGQAACSCPNPLHSVRKAECVEEAQSLLLLLEHGGVAENAVTH